jgi:hypothetical protein
LHDLPEVRLLSPSQQLRQLAMFSTLRHRD